MSWLDLVFASPALGFTTEPTLRSQHELLDRLRPLVHVWAKESPGLQFGTKDILSVSVGTPNGFAFQASNTDLVATQQFAPTFKNRAGGLPVLDEVEIRQYSAALTDLTERFEKFVVAVVAAGDASLVRVGVVADCRINTTTAPPGVLRFLEHLEYPWPKPAGRFDFTLLAVLSDGEDYRDQCHHTVKLDRIDGDSHDLQLRLDWQRVFKKPKAFTAKEMTKQMHGWIAAGLEYFEAFGNGELRYREEIT